VKGGGTEKRTISPNKKNVKGSSSIGPRGGGGKVCTFVYPPSYQL